MSSSTYSGAELRRLTEFAMKRARKIGGDWLSREDIEDVAQDVLRRLVLESPAPDNPDAWVTTAVRNRVVDMYRAKERGLALEDYDDLEVDKPDAALQTWAQNQVPVSAGGMRDQAMKYLLEQLGEVYTAKEIDVLVLIAGGQSYEEIAAELGYRNADSVKSTVHKIRLKAEKLDRGALEALKNHPYNYPVQRTRRRPPGRGDDRAN